MGAWQFLAVTAGSFLISATTVWLSIRIAHKVGALDRPDGGRKHQTVAIPRLGGLAVAVAYSSASILILLMFGQWWQLPLALGVLVPAMTAAAIGLADDIRDLHPYLRLALQAGVGVLAFSLGNRVSISGSWLVDLVLTVIWVMVIINGLNLLDNSDGLAASTVLVTASASLFISLIFGQFFIAALAASLIGVTLGFLLHNWYPARVYLGDSGAYFLGALVALLVLRIRPTEMNAIEGVVIAFLLVLLPIVDTTFVAISRLRRGVHPFTAGRDHLSHRLQDLGLRIPISVATLQAVSIAGCSVAVGLVLF